MGQPEFRVIHKNVLNKCVHCWIHNILYTYIHIWQKTKNIIMETIERDKCKLRPINISLENLFCSIFVKIYFCVMRTLFGRCERVEKLYYTIHYIFNIRQLYIFMCWFLGWKFGIGRKVHIFLHTTTVLHNLPHPMFQWMACTRTRHNLYYMNIFYHGLALTLCGNIYFFIWFGFWFQFFFLLKHTHIAFTLHIKLTPNNQLFWQNLIDLELLHQGRI